MKACLSAIIILFSLSSMADVSLRVNGFGIACEKKRDLGNKGFSLWDAKVVDAQESYLNIQVNAVRKVCISAPRGLVSWERTRLPQEDSIEAQDWDRSVFSTPSYEGDRIGTEGHLVNLVRFTFPMDENFLPRRKLRRLAKGKTINKKVTLFYMNRSEPDHRDRRIFRSKGSFELSLKIFRGLNGNVKADVVSLKRI